MSDRLAEIEALRKSVDRRGLYGVHLETDVRVTTGLARALLAAVDAARDVLQAHDEADGEMDWTGPTVDTLLRAALANLEGGACPECNDTGMIRLGEDDGQHEDVACLRCNLERGA